MLRSARIVILLAVFACVPKTDKFTAAIAAPTLISATPTTVVRGLGCFSVTGTGLLGTSSATLDAVPVVFTVVSPTALRVCPDAGATPGSLGLGIVAPGGNAVLTTRLTLVDQALSLAPFAGAKVAAGASIALVGGGFDAINPNNQVVTFAGGATADIVSVAADRLVVSLPANAASGKVTVALTSVDPPETVTSSDSLIVLQPFAIAVVTSPRARGAFGGETVTVDLNRPAEEVAAAQPSVTIDGAVATLVSIDDSADGNAHLAVVVPPGVALSPHTASLCVSGATALACADLPLLGVGHSDLTRSAACDGANLSNISGPLVLTSGWPPIVESTSQLYDAYALDAARQVVYDMDLGHNDIAKSIALPKGDYALMVATESNVADHFAFVDTTTNTLWEYTDNVGLRSLAIGEAVSGLAYTEIGEAYLLLATPTRLLRVDATQPTALSATQTPFASGDVFVDWVAVDTNDTYRENWAVLLQNGNSLRWAFADVDGSPSAPVLSTDIASPVPPAPRLQVNWISGENVAAIATFGACAKGYWLQSFSAPTPAPSRTLLASRQLVLGCPLGACFSLGCDGEASIMSPLAVSAYDTTVNGHWIAAWGAAGTPGDVGEGPGLYLGFLLGHFSNFVATAGLATLPATGGCTSTGCLQGQRFEGVPSAAVYLSVDYDHKDDRIVIAATADGLSSYALSAVGSTATFTAAFTLSPFNAHLLTNLFGETSLAYMDTAGALRFFDGASGFSSNTFNTGVPTPALQTTQNGYSLTLATFPGLAAERALDASAATVNPIWLPGDGGRIGDDPVSGGDIGIDLSPAGDALLLTPYVQSAPQLDEQFTLPIDTSALACCNEAAVSCTPVAPVFTTLSSGDGSWIEAGSCSDGYDAPRCSHDDPVRLSYADPNQPLGGSCTQTILPSCDSLGMPESDQCRRSRTLHFWSDVGASLERYDTDLCGEQATPLRLVDGPNATSLVIWQTVHPAAGPGWVCQSTWQVVAPTRVPVFASLLSFDADGTVQNLTGSSNGTGLSALDLVDLNETVLARNVAYDALFSRWLFIITAADGSTILRSLSSSLQRSDLLTVPASLVMTLSPDSQRLYLLLADGQTVSVFANQAVPVPIAQASLPLPGADIAMARDGQSLAVSVAGGACSLSD